MASSASSFWLLNFHHLIFSNISKRSLKLSFVHFLMGMKVISCSSLSMILLIILGFSEGQNFFKLQTKNSRIVLISCISVVDRYSSMQFGLRREVIVFVSYSSKSENTQSKVFDLLENK